MLPYQIFENKFSTNHIIEHYNEKIKGKASVGIDKVNSVKFEEQLNDNVELIKGKVLLGTYKFTRYKKILINKGEDKPPRVICLPTIRDKLVLSILNECLVSIYGEICNSPLPHSLVSSLSHSFLSGDYDYFIKIDISKFYSSINHYILFCKLRKKIRKKQILKLLKEAIETPSIEVPKRKREVPCKREKGVPEGLSISNALANIFLKELDDKYKNKEKISYYRYVDDIIILCSSIDASRLAQEVIDELSALDLEVNDKTEMGVLEKGFDYIGYKFIAPTISVRESSVLKIEDALEKTFSNYKYAQHPNSRFLEWRLNLRITGCIIEGKKYGWSFFFSQINDMELLSHLDWMINKLSIRYGVLGKIKCKSFKRTHYEIIYRLYMTKYIPNFDDFTLEDKKAILSNIYNMNLEGLDDSRVFLEFNKIIKKEIKELEKDIQFIS